MTNTKLQKVALFDFDKTIHNGDTIGTYALCNLLKRPHHVIFIICFAILYCLHKFHITDRRSVLTFQFMPIKYFTDNELCQIFRDKVDNNYFPNIVAELKKKKEEGYHIVICTASVYAYMQYCELPFDCLIATNTERVNGRYTNKLIGKECKGAEKVVRINEYLKENNIEIDYENSYGYSDSKHDIPMLKLVKNRKRVALKTGELSEFLC